MPWILSVKLLLISLTVISIAVTTKLTVPLMFSFAVNGLPAIWSVVATWLKPPYLYVIINAIIITIAATTRFQHNHHQQSPNEPPPSDLTPVNYDIAPSEGDSDVGLETVAAGGGQVVVVGGNEGEVVALGSTWNEIQSVEPEKKVEPDEPEFVFPVEEKQPVTSRFANNRKPVKANPEGARALRVLKPKKHETLETTWKMIADGRQLPLTRHLRKSDTFNDVNNIHPSNESSTTKSKVVKKSETFKDRTTYANQNDYPPPPPVTNLSPEAGGKLKKDVSLGQDELNRRVEAFIKKFNDDMRLQRQESLKQYMEMVNGGARR
ncbi:uncharacterized protein LOC143611102 [Bidens hawaiensis]|uniref:uncharacterized protein LOC143530772 n=1 Tax=Bidens hawaiensis TaxID=980011 RepID=UPI00404B825A